MSQSFQIIIVGAGLSGLSLAHFLRAAAPDRDLLLLEQGERPGGAIRSFAAEGYRAEWGPHGFLDNNAASGALLTKTGLDRIAQKAPLGSFVRYVCHNRRLVSLPQNPAALLKTELLSPLGKIRLLGEFFKRPVASEQSIGQWAAHRFGPELLPLVDAAVTGTFAGDYQRLSIDAVMPGVRRIEQENGSLLLGLLRKKRQGVKKALPAMTSFPEGMEQLVGVLAQNTPISYQSPVRAISRGDRFWLVETESKSYQTENLVLALPVNQALALLADYDPPLRAVPTASIATIPLGFAASGAQIPPGFGYLAPEREGRFSLGALFSSNMFPGRAPEGRVLIEALVGGRRHPERLELDDQQLVERVYQDIASLLPLPEPPVFHRVLRGGHAIPQLELGHPALLAWKRGLEARLTGLSLCGFGWEGIGMNDMIKGAEELAQRMLSGKEGEAAPGVRPVYF